MILHDTHVSLRDSGLRGSYRFSLGLRHPSSYSNVSASWFCFYPIYGSFYCGPWTLHVCPLITNMFMQFQPLQALEPKQDRSAADQQLFWLSGKSETRQTK